MEESLGSIGSSVSLETTLVASHHLTTKKALDLQLCSTPHPALWLGDMAHEQDSGSKSKWL